MGKAFLKRTAIEGIATEAAIYVTGQVVGVGVEYSGEFIEAYSGFIDEVENTWNVGVPIPPGGWPAMTFFRLACGLAFAVQPHEFFVDESEPGIISAQSGLILPG